MENSNWLILTYKVPPEPARKRMALWRKIKGLGAIYLQNGVCLLPRTDENFRRMRMAENDISEMDGEAILLETTSPDESETEKIVGRFNEERDAAYHEFLEQCGVFEEELAKERAAEKFTFAELEENDENLQKLRGWLEKIQKLDFYNAPLGPQAVQRLAECESLLDAYGNDVFVAHEENRSEGRRKGGK